MDFAGTGRVTSGVSRPIYTHEISILLEIVLNLAVEGALDGLANAARQMDVRRVDYDPCGSSSMLMIRLSGCSFFSASS